MRVLVTGAAGMLGSSLCPLLEKQGFAVIATDKVSLDGILDLDITDAANVNKLVEKYTPEIIFHLAAETDVDKCEKEPEHAYLVNARGTENLAQASLRAGCILVYISTGGVFDGESPEAYTESDQPNPKNVYSRAKWEGEKIVAALLKKYYIVRAGWMFGGGHLDKKFVGKIVDLLSTKKELKVVDDKFGSPTFTEDLARALVALVKTGRYGLYHSANVGCCSRYEMAVKIVECLGLSGIKINPISSDAFPLPAYRIRSESLANSKLNRYKIYAMRPWQEALCEYVKRHAQEKALFKQ
ncbi:MAG: dTDP-4-dehydrorhamnose reductase [Candidatus Omnitrophota bacterium]